MPTRPHHPRQLLLHIPHMNLVLDLSSLQRARRTLLGRIALVGFRALVDADMALVVLGGPPGDEAVEVVVVADLATCLA